MTLRVSDFTKQNTAFKSGNIETEQKPVPKDDKLLSNNFSTQARIGIDKFTKAFTIYPARGIRGSINSNFYEFLTMGTVPYVIGSLMLMSVFNSANKYFSISESAKASKLGNKMALGVLFFGLFKEISKSFINLPVKWITGVDTQIPYRKVNHHLPEYIGDKDLTSFEYHKAGESVEFTRWDLLYGDPNNKKDLNKRYDKIAKKNGLGENLNDSDQEVKPLYREVLIKSSLARNISSYFWAATGVSLAFQKPWENFIQKGTLKFWKPNEFLHTVKMFGSNFVESFKTLYNGPSGNVSKFEKHCGKALLGITAAVTLLGLLNTLHITKKPSKTTESDVLDKNKESVVC